MILFDLRGAMKKDPDDCGHEKKYCPKHDAYYCEKCDQWLEKKCNDDRCEYCHERPEKPSSLKK